MKKIIIIITLIILSIPSIAQDFPYKKMLIMNEKELLDAKFKYNKDLNQWILKRIDGWQVVANILDENSDMRRGKNDYMITIQNGEDEVSSVDVTFYDDEIFHKIMTFAKDKGEDIVETSSGNLNKVQFNYDGYSLVLQYDRQTTAVTSVNSYTYSTSVRTVDDSYNEYKFKIFTGAAPVSPFLKRTAEREAKRLEKGRKHSSAADLM